MNAKEFKRERCTDMTQTEAMEAYAAHKVGEVAGPLAKALSSARNAITAFVPNEYQAMIEPKLAEIDAALHAYREAVGK